MGRSRVCWWVWAWSVLLMGAAPLDDLDLDLIDLADIDLDDFLDLVDLADLAFTNLDDSGRGLAMTTCLLDFPDFTLDKRFSWPTPSW